MSEPNHEKTHNRQLDSIIAKFSSLGFTQLTEIQKRAIPQIIQKKDSLIIAPTGSGKTECSVIPAFASVSPTRKAGRIKALYVTPLRALNRDVFQRVIKYAEAEGLTIEIRHGDTSQYARKKITENPPDVLITTPETLVILLTQQKMLEALSELEWIIIDEIHDLLSNERGAQLSVSLERLQLNTKLPMTRIGLSATVGNPSDAAKFLVGTKRKCQIIRDNTIRKYDVQIKHINGTINEVADFIIDYLVKLNLDSPVLLFTNTRGEAEFLASILREKSPISVELHHGSLSQQVREETEQNLKSGKSRLVVCTSSLELGLDIGSVELVMHYGSPRQVSKFMQRIGRSKHNKHSSAKGLIITNNVDDELETTAILERIRQGSIEEQKIHDGSLDVLAHHLVGIVMQMGEVTVDFALDIIKNSYMFRNITLEDLVDVLDLLDSNFLISFDREKMSFKKSSKCYRYYFENLSTIPDILKFKVFDTITKKIIGSLDQRFVGDHGEPGNIFVLRGMQWKIINVDESAQKVNVEPIRAGGTTVPYWEGENIPVDYKTASKVGHFRTKIKSGTLNLPDNVIVQLDMPTIPDEKNIVAESQKGQGIIVLHACFGTKINATLALVLSSMLSSNTGFQVESRSDAYRIVISSKGRVTENQVRQILADNYNLYEIVSASLNGTHNVSWRTWTVAKKFGVVGRGAVYEKKSARFLFDRYTKTPLVREALRELFHDKYDIEATKKTLDDIRAGQIRMHWLDVSKFSKLAEPILDHTAKYYSSPTNIDKGLLDLVKNRLFKTTHRLVCARCGRWEKVVHTGEIERIPVCPYCKARQITSTYYSDYDLAKIIQKKAAGKKITAEENHRFSRAWKVASLLANFGKTALIVLSGYGVGADTASRILKNMVDEENLYRQIYEAERLYVTTRGFWD
ncbi:DEAD/DEAH box helicase [Candidatus Nitrosotenuis uzonensis]|uniref:DEAD/DEAH box helicase domain protein n=1 Tax=Candidatus Nitrosotenuis uzonensis TaxID=1407055 RepID=A0A812EXA2_9ARCH|nr:DEAD/DEAH box helicase [Candidatus Nitrosotenuis uzonensis]CAE6488537.1 DEAD/DEAH box helicase domain protein [Candidatus Nitrosotenuis uzonensis]